MAKRGRKLEMMGKYLKMIEFAGPSAENKDSFILCEKWKGKQQLKTGFERNCLFENLPK